MPTEIAQDHIAYIQVSHQIIHDLLQIDECDTQGKLRNDGVFDRIHQRLLLPDHYTIKAILCEPMRRVWKIFVESEHLPPVPEYEDCPEVVLTYSQDEDGRSVHLVNARVMKVYRALSQRDYLSSLLK